MLLRHGFKAIRTGKVVYGWASEYDADDDVPVEITDTDPSHPRPWDWMVLAERLGEGGPAAL